MLDDLHFDVVASNGKLRKARIPDGQRVYAIGDIHGRVDLLKRLLVDIKEDASRYMAEAENVIVYLGDYIDRGAKSKEVLNVVCSPPLDGFSSVCLLGNHELMLMRFLAGEDRDGNWLKAGGVQTAYSYGVQRDLPKQWKDRVNAIREKLASIIPETHKKFMKALKTNYVCGDYLFVHAGIDLKQPIENQVANDLVWGSDAFLKNDKKMDKITVHGHFVQKEFQVGPSRLGIDTGAYATGRLTCAVFEKETVRILST